MRYNQFVIAKDQPTIFHDDILVAVSSVQDGTIRHPSKDTQAPESIRRLCGTLGIVLGKTVGLYITYGDDRSYADIVDVRQTLDTQGAAVEAGWIKADALVTAAPGVALLLPVADCNAVIMYDPARKVIALAHLGWHATVNNFAAKLVRHLQKTYHTNPADLLVSFPPSIRKESYVFDYLEPTKITDWHAEPYATKGEGGKYHIDLVAYNIDQLTGAGVALGNIEVSPVDSAKDGNYYSHFMRHQLGDHPKANGRFAVLAMIKE